MLTVFAIENAKPREKVYRVSDGNVLALQVETNGSKLWRFRYRFGGKENMLTFGPFPQVGLAAAREKRDEARKLLAAGANPSQHRKDEKRAAATAGGNTFKVVATDYIAKLRAEGKAETTLSKNEWLLLDLASPLAERPITELKPADFSSFGGSVA
jgi:hypothetical protein